RGASGEPMYGKVLVCQCVENRVNDPRWPESYRDVILQPRQFSAFNKDDPNSLRFPKAMDDEAWEACVAAADMVISSPESFTSANHYHTHRVTPNWADATKVTE